MTDATKVGDTLKRPLPQVTFSTPETVAVRIRGEGGDGIRLPSDGGLIFKFIGWLIENEMWSLSLGGHSGPGTYLGFFDPEYLPRIREWLTLNGAIEDDKKTWEKR